MSQHSGRGWVRVIAGAHRGRRLATLPGLDLRPTSDRVRESLFGILGGRIPGAVVVDCFAGTGALGLEALSRGASRAIFVERDARALALLAENVEGLGEGARSRILRADALVPGTWPREGFPADLVLADPPYRKDLPGRFLAGLAGAGVVSRGGVVVIEHERDADPAHPFWALVDRRRYGDTSVSIYAARGSGGDEETP